MQEDWDDLRLVLALARSGGVRAAATALGLDPTTVTRRLARAERRAGAALLARSAQGLRPTEAGRAMLQAAERAEAAIQGAQTALGQGRGGNETGRGRRAAQVVGHVRLTAVPILANRIIVPALPAHLAAHPGLSLEVVAEPRNLALMERETDIALRLARPERELAAKARRIGRLAYAVYGAAGCDAAAMPWIGYGGAMAALPQARWIEAQARGAAALPQARWIETQAHGAAALPLRVQDAETLLQAVLAGLGKSVLPALVADRWLAAAPAAPPADHGHQNAPDGAPNEMPPGIPAGTPPGTAPGAHPGTLTGATFGIAPDTPLDMHPGTNFDTPPGTPSGKASGTPPGTPRGAPRGAPNETPSGISRGAPPESHLQTFPETFPARPAETSGAGLVRLTGATPPEREIWMMTHPRLGKLPAVSVTASWLAALFAS